MQNPKRKKLCKSCQKLKPLSAFYMTRSGGKVYARSQCKKCHNASSLAAFKKHPEYQQRIQANRRIKRAAIPFDYYRAQLLGWSLEKALSVYKQQKGRCAICKKKPKRNRLALDHNHETGIPRAFLCGHCNGDLAAVESPARLRQLLSYLEQHERTNK